MADEVILDIQKTDSGDIVSRRLRGVQPPWLDFHGYEITTSKRTIQVGISSEPHCCENFGIQFLTDNEENAYEKLIDQKLLRVHWGLDKPLYTLIDGSKPDSLSEKYMGKYTQCACVNFVTETMTAQIVAWVHHNGYYPHQIYVNWGDEKHSIGGHDETQDI